MNPRLLIGGLKSYLPLPTTKYKGTGGTLTGRYCYSVWLRHRSLIARYVKGFSARKMVELGPGDSIGLGLAALLSEIDSYVGLDVLEHATAEVNLRVFDELVVLFRQQAPIPDHHEFPRLQPRLSSYAFPSEVMDPLILRERLSAENLTRLRKAIESPDEGDPAIQYRTPWTTASVKPGWADLVISHGALQDMDHTSKKDDLRANLESMVNWLKPGGVMSHHIELSCPGGAAWNHHWTYSDTAWAIVRGRRPYYKNRVPLSEYLSLLEALNCKVMGVERVERDGLGRHQVAPRFRDLPEQDFHCAAALVVVVKQ